MKGKIYPAIYKSTKNDTYLCVSATEQYSMDIGVWIGGDYPDHESDTNITHEYLANTYGEVQSPAHAEFIIELAELHGFELISNGTSNKNFFHIGGKSFAMLINEPTFKGGCKQITIPLPPKTEPLKNAGDNLVLGCENSKCDEWPRVGDNVTWGDKSVKGEVKALSDGLAWIKNEYGNYCSEYVSSLQKPKTPEEDLRDDIVQLIDDADGLSSHVLALALMDKFSIKPQ